MKFKFLVALLISVSFASFAEIKQELGVDQSVDYAALESLGPWDDRNYQLTQADLDVIPENDQYLRNVPLFYKVKSRKSNPLLGKYYNRELYQSFLIEYGGLLVDGIWYKEGLGLYRHPNTLGGKADPEFRGGTVDPDLEVLLTAGAESTIEFNPDNNMQAVAGVNAGGGQSMFFSTDGGVTWTLSQVNPSSCCDPTVDWSTTALTTQRVYQADLASCIASGCNIRASFSDDAGATWATMIVIDGDQQNDKEFIHVDRSAASAFVDNVYITYHKGNVMQFAKSEDNGETWSTPVGLNTGDRGIGSDITTDSAGNVYYIYPSVSGAGLISMKSTDGGDTFAAPVQITPLRGDFDFPVPAMETREVFIYAAADVDSSNNIYVAITDETADSAGGGQTNTPLNRGEIRVFKSTDAGDTWTELTKPHADDGFLSGGSDNAIDRFHPWMMVGENDAIHIGFYDTRNSVNRTGVDFYYNVSTDGGATWLPEGEQRFSTQTSSNLTDGFEWGDYNGLSVVNDKLAMIWTDNRSAVKNTLVGLDENQFGSPTFNVAATPNNIDVCANDTGLSIQLDVSAVQAYPGIVTLSESSTPGFVSGGAFSTNTLAAPFTSNYTFDVDGSGTAGSETITIGSSGDDMGNIIMKSTDITVNYSSAVPGASTLMMPADDATGVLLNPTLSWSADANANSYFVEVATDSGFANVVDSATVTDTQYTTAVTLLGDTEYFWRVTTDGTCGAGATSAVFTFNTSDLLCFSSGVEIPDNDPTGLNLTGTVTEMGALSGLTVSVLADHTWVGDLIFTLEHAGTTITLQDRVIGTANPAFGCNGDNMDVIFDDSSATSVQDACLEDGTDPSLSGNLSPVDELAAFTGLEFSGDWTLNVTDNAGGDLGSVTEFCLFPVLGPSDVIFANGFE